MKKLKIDKVYSQNDPSWKATLLGFNTDAKYTIGNFGCKLSDFAMFLTAIGKNYTPLTLNELFKQKKLFVNFGELSDDVIPTAFPDLSKYYASMKYDGLVPDSVLLKIKSLIDTGYLVFAEVDFYPATVNEDMHFVLIYGYDDAGKFLIIDPWTGTKTTLSIYGDPARVLYRVWCYATTLPFEDEMISIGKKMYEWLIGRATAIKNVASYLSKPEPDNTSDQQIIDSIEGIRSQATTCQNSLETTKTELANRIEQVDRIKQEAAASATQALQRQDELQGIIKLKEETIGSLTGQIATIQQEKTDLAKEKGALNNIIGSLTAENKRLKEQGAAGLTIWDAWKLVLKKLIPWAKATKV